MSRLAFAAGVLALTTHVALAAPRQVLCTHPFAEDHPLVTGFLEPWANGVNVDSQGALRLVLRQAEEGGECALAPMGGTLAEVFELPFVFVDRAEEASEAAWALVNAGTEQDPGLLAVVMLGPSVVAVSSSEARPLPGSLQGHAILVESRPVAHLLDGLEAETLAGPGDKAQTGALVPLVEAPGAAWIMSFGGGRSLFSRAYALRISSEVQAELPASELALITQIPGARLSAAAGRALDRRAAVVLEEFGARRADIALAEDWVGRLLDEAAALRVQWADTVERETLLGEVLDQKP